MRLTLSRSLYVLFIALLGCSASRVEDAPQRGAVVRTELRSSRSKAATAAAPAKASTAKGAAGDIEWGDQIAWRSWESALSAAQSESKSICVVVYADWCARCKELAPAFSSPAVTSAAHGLLMVRQDQDERPAWLQEKLGSYGSYVPRVLFLDPNGNVREDIQSGHPRYPYFYGALVADQLVANMRTASGG